jgi:PAS domain S-box-containing protein
VSPSRKLRNTVGWLGLCIGFTVAAGVPAGYLWMAYAQLDHQLSVVAAVKAVRLADYISLNPQTWRHETGRLAELIELPEAKDADEQQRVFDATGELVLETGKPPASPVTRSRPVIVAGLPVARLETTTTFRPVLVATAVVAAFSGVLGLAILFVMRTLPRRTIDRALAELEETQGRLLATIDAIPIEFMEYDREGRLILVNSAARLSQGWDSDSIGKTERELLTKILGERQAADPEHDWTGFIVERLGTLDRLGSYEMTRPTGETGRFFVKHMPGGGKVVIRIDITESKQREAELAVMQNRYRLLFDSNPQPMAVIVIETDRFLAVNDAAVKQYGWSREEFLAMTSSDALYLPEDLPIVLAERSRKEERATVRDLRGVRHRRKDGSHFDVEMSIRPLDFDGVPAMLVMAQDVTARNRAERARRAAEAQLRQSQKMEAVGQLTGGIAHDFNNILMVILSHADALREESHDAATADRLEQISQAVERAIGLTRQLLAFSRKQPLNPKPTDINKLVAGIGSLLGRVLGENIEINSVLAVPLWMTNVDQSQLEAALINLCVNARDAMPGGGQLLIETRNITLDAGYVAGNPDATAGDYVVLSVADTGSGMAPETLAKVFDPFFTTKGAGKGTGLGLSMVYGFIKQSMGHIRVVSELGRGTCFTLHLPRDDSARAEPAVRQAAGIVGGHERILVVEDEAQVRASVVQQLQSLGYVVSQAGDGTAGLAAFEAAATPYDLLLTDVIMPGPLNGKALAEAVVERWPATKVVFMSGYSEDAIIHGGRLDAGTLLLSKPFRKKDLAQIVRQALAGSSAPGGAA